MKSFVEYFGFNQIKPAYRQRIPANVKAAMIVDTNGDGFKELVIKFYFAIQLNSLWLNFNYTLGCDFDRQGGADLPMASHWRYHFHAWV